MTPPAFYKRELHIILPSLSPSPPRPPPLVLPRLLPPLPLVQAHPSTLHRHLPHLSRHIHTLKRRIITHPLKERHTEARSHPRRRRNHPVRRALAHPLRQRFQALSDRHHERAGQGWALDPFPREVLRLQAPLRWDLEEVAR